MTLEEKIDERYSQMLNSFLLKRDAKCFRDSANWMLSELKPVMEEMKEALSEYMVYSADPPTEELAKQALSKYNELFKK